MKQNQMYLLVLTCLVILPKIAFGQENIYITSKYDFIPGEKVIFFDDFTSENIGDFPAQWITNGSGEIVTSAKFPGKWFHMTKMGYYIPETKDDFTENFTIEFDFIPMNTAGSETMFGISFYLLTGSLSEPGGGGEPADAGFQVFMDYDNLNWKNWSSLTDQRPNGMITYPFKSNEKYHIAIWVQKQRVRFYANENKVLDVPRAIPTGSKPNIFRFDSRDEAIPLISNFRIAAGLSDMRNSFLKDGKIISYGILFDVNSDKLKPESYSTLRVISDILKENPAINIQIVGHTDSDGDDASNLDLSKRRAMSVKNELAAKFGISVERLTYEGKGESEPIAPNDNSVNKAKNRRVEFINKKNPISVTEAIKPQSSESTSMLTDIDGNKYKTITIGERVWMAENLKTTKFNDGKPIELVSDSIAWTELKTPSYCWFKNNESTFKNSYGAIYNWYSVTTGKLCPLGWSIPADTVWSMLESYLEEPAGGKLKEKGFSHWKVPNTGASNESGFLALPGGGRGSDGSFNHFILGTIGERGNWWSVSMQEWPNWVGLQYDNNKLSFGGGTEKQIGVSVRCIKD